LPDLKNEKKVTTEKKKEIDRGRLSTGKESKRAGLGKSGRGRNFWHQVMWEKRSVAIRIRKKRREHSR